MTARTDIIILSYCCRYEALESDEEKGSDNESDVSIRFLFHDCYVQYLIIISCVVAHISY